MIKIAGMVLYKEKMCIFDIYNHLNVSNLFISS